MHTVKTINYAQGIKDLRKIMDQLNTIIGSEFYDLESNKWTIHGITERRQLLILWSRETGQCKYITYEYYNQIFST